MGYFDTIIIKEIDCCKCKKKIKNPDGQTKHHESLRVFKAGNYFDKRLKYIDVYTSCTHCDYWNDYWVRIDIKGCITNDYVINKTGETYNLKQSEIPVFEKEYENPKNK